MTQYIFEIEWYNKNSGTEEIEFGMTAADSYAEAINNIIDDYGEEVVAGIKLINFDDGNTFTLTREEFEARIKDGNFKM